MATPKRDADIRRYEQSIYNSLQTMHPDPRATEIERLRGLSEDPTWGTEDWREATRRAIARFEARP